VQARQAAEAGRERTQRLRKRERIRVGEPKAE